MNDKIYLIVSGHYSDWDVHGFAESEEEAKKVVAMKNSDAYSRHGYYSADFYYIETERLKIETAPDQIKPVPRRTVSIYPGRCFVSPMNYGTIEYFQAGTPPVVDKIFWKGKAWEQANVHVFTDSTDEKKIQKIAYDTLYQELARIAEVSEAVNRTQY